MRNGSAIKENGCVITCKTSQFRAECYCRLISGHDIAGKSELLPLDLDLPMVNMYVAAGEVI